MRGIISGKGQVKVSSEVREQPGPGAPLRDEGNGISGSHPVDRVWATLNSDSPVDDLLEEMRGPQPGKTYG